MAKCSPAGEYPRIFPNFQNCVCCEKDFKNNKHNSLHLAWKCAQIFVLGHCLFFEAHSFPQAVLSQNCLLLGTDYVHRQISKHISMPYEGYCICLLVSRGKCLPLDPSFKFPQFTPKSPPPCLPNYPNCQDWLQQILFWAPKFSTASALRMIPIIQSK